MARVQRERVLPPLPAETAEDGRIRRYLPKRTSLDDLTDEDLQAIVQEINDTPHEGPGLGNTQRGLVPQTRQGNVEDKPPTDKRCTYK